MAFGVAKWPDLQAYLKGIDLTRIPSEAEIDEILVKRLTKGALVLKRLAAGERIENGDCVLFSITGSKPRYNKEKLMVTVGEGLYSKELEANMTAHTVGDEYDDMAKDSPVHIIIREVKRKEVPEPTDAMVEAMGIEGVKTITQYRGHLAGELMDNVIYPLTGEILEKMVEECRPEEPTQEIVERFGELEIDFFSSHFKEHLGKGLDTFSEEDFKENLGCLSAEEFKQSRREWYVIKAKQCAVLAAALGIELCGEYNPLKNYEVLGMLQKKMADAVREYVCI